MKVSRNLYVVRAAQHAQWLEVLLQSHQYDFYHLPEYHLLAEQRGEGAAHLFVYNEEDYLIAIPLLLRSLDSVPGFTQHGRGLWDATSVYGYSGPIISHPDTPASVIRNFRSALRETLQERNIVSVFTRLHPLIAHRTILAGLGEYVPSGKTVSIDLCLSINAQRAGYRRDHKLAINKLRRLGVTCLHDKDGVYLDEFVDIYHENMRRVKASSEYFFDRTYFQNLVNELKANVHLFLCLLDNKVVCGGLFTFCHGIVQYHLSGTRDEFLKLAPMKLLLDEVRLQAYQQGEKVFHLGGGVGSREDSLFEFKAGFSDRRHEFAVWRWVVLGDVYEQLCKKRAQWNTQQGVTPVSLAYFPQYRCLTIPVEHGSMVQALS